MHLLLLSLIVASATALPGGAKEKIMERLNKYNFDVECWGRQNVWDMYREQEAALTTCSGAYPTALPAVIPLAHLYQPLQVPYSLASPFQPVAYAHSYGKRSPHPHTGLTYTSLSGAEKLETWLNYREELGSKLGNLSCVLNQLDMLTPTGQINPNFIQNKFWDMHDLSTSLAGQDPEFRNGLTARWSDCLNMANAAPADALLRLNPLIKDVEICRHMMFFKCAMKAKTHVCAAAQVHRYLGHKFGGDDGTVNWPLYGLPDNKYELAAATAMVMMDTMDPVEQFVEDFFRSNGMEY